MALGGKVSRGLGEKNNYKKKVENLRGDVGRVGGGGRVKVIPQ